ncbi:TetR family transcriptional regulator [Microbacterium testaceum]|uniref:TetR/AcrR family transcriptional regulator n=1 Tax=Microbacterium testaceum TaxID=2033 RepID=UPI003421BF4B
MSPRRYASPLRKAEAARTRAAILDAAAALFSRDGYAATTMKGIAVEAGVSVQSVHLAGSKSALLVAAFERAFSGAEAQDSPAQPPLIVAALERLEVDEAMRVWLDGIARAHERSAGLARAMAIAAETDAVAAAALVDFDARRRGGIRVASDWLVGRGLLHAEDADEVADELSYLVGPETYAFFVTRSGWSPARYRGWLERTLRDLLARRTTDIPVS